MDSEVEGLSNWQLLTQQRVHSRSQPQRVTSKNDIHDWLQTVENAATTPSSIKTPSSINTPSFDLPLPSLASHTKPYSYLATKTKTKKKIEEITEDARIKESAYAEAQEILNQWVQEKVYSDAGLDDAYDDFDPAKYLNKSNKADIKAQWDKLTKLSDDDEEEEMESARMTSPEDPQEIYRILDQDDNKVVNNIMGTLLRKPIFPKHVTEDLGFEDRKKPKVDPRVKMDLRHKMVKENREKRMAEEKKKRDERRLKKETQFQARQIVQQEEKQKVAVQKKEEMEVQKQMAIIRKQMEEEKRLLEEQRNRERREKDDLARRAQEELEKQREEERRQQRKAQIVVEEKQRNLQMKLGEMEAKQQAEKLKCLQRCFSAWYGEVVTRRVQMAKARATSDWKATLRAWNAWRAYVRDKHLDVETRRHEQDVRETHRKTELAKHHHRLHLLRKYFLVWQIHTQSQLVAKEVDESKMATQSKMAAFLQAAAERKLRKKDETAEDSSEEEDVENIQVDEVFMAEVRAAQHRANPSSSRSSSQFTTRSEYLARNKKTVSKPTQAWQITKKHIKVTKKELEAYNKAHGEEENNDQSQTDRCSAVSGDKPWQKAPFVPDSFSNRHTAQQKMLEQQQKQIKEQQKLIEDLTYLQKQQMLQQQVLQSQAQQLTAASKGQLNGGGDGSPSKLQQHIENLQKELIAKNENLDELQREIEKTQEQDTARSDLTQISKVSGVSSNKSTLSTSRTNISHTTTDSKHLSFLKSMEERANERIRIKKEREEKKRKEEEEKRAAMREEQERMVKEQEEEKRKKVEAFREKKRLEKEQELEKQRNLERMKELTKVAEANCERSVLKYRGWLPWLRLVEMARERQKRAEEHYKHIILRKCLLSWHQTVQFELQKKKATADHFYHFVLVRRYFNNWKKYGQAMSIQEEKADRHYNEKLKERVIETWKDYAAAETVAMWHKERKAKEHNTRRIQLTCLRAWRRYPSVLKDEKRKGKRLLEMRQKVAALLPDYSIDTDKADISFS